MKKNKNKNKTKKIIALASLIAIFTNTSYAMNADLKVSANITSGCLLFAKDIPLNIKSTNSYSDDLTIADAKIQCSKGSVVNIFIKSKNFNSFTHSDE